VAQPAGIDRDAVIEMASTMVDDEGVPSLTLSALAKRLGIRTPSLYAHVEGFDGLIRDLALEGVRQLGEELRSSVLGRSGREALFAVANAYRRYATEHPGLYSLTVHDPGNDADMRRANDRAAEALRAVLESFGAFGTDNVHLYRALWSTVHGFVTIEATGVMTLPADTDESFRRAVEIFAHHLEDYKPSDSES
jgi:AcrR family transcriptional regulator